MVRTAKSAPYLGNVGQEQTADLRLHVYTAVKFAIEVVTDGAKLCGAAVIC